MTFSREEIAVRVNEALLAYVEAHGHSPGCDVSMFVGREKCNCGYTELACALRAILLTPTRAPVAPPAGKYEPAVGDIVIGLFGDDGLARVDSVDPTRWSALCDGTWRSGFRFGVTSTARLATDAEKRAAGLAVPPPAPTPAPEAKCEMCGGPHVRDVFHAADLQPPAPEAKRPEWVTYEVVPGCRSNPYAVLRWDENGSPVVGPPDRSWALREWEPCAAPCPPPVAGRMEKDALRDAESQVIEAAIRWRAAYCGGAGDYINDAADERVALDSAVANLATLRSALSRPVRP